MRIIITPREALDGDYWEELCDMKGISVWAVKEGLMGRRDSIELTDEEAHELRII